MCTRQHLEQVYELLLRCYGPQHWWPAEDNFEMIVGAILTQSTAWTNVEKAIANLKQAGALRPDTIREIPAAELAQLIYPSGYYNVKARKLKSFAQHLSDSYADSLELLFALETVPLRRELLSIYGIGPETADSIILYAARKPVFVIDAYTIRIIKRLGLYRNDEGSYASLQAFFMNGLPHDEPMFNEYHALLVCLGKYACRRTRPACHQCCLQTICEFAAAAGTRP